MQKRYQNRYDLQWKVVNSMKGISENKKNKTKVNQRGACIAWQKLQTQITTKIKIANLVSCIFYIKIAQKEYVEYQVSL